VSNSNSNNNILNLSSVTNSPNLNMNNSNISQNLQFKQQPINSPLRNNTTNYTINQYTSSSPVISQASQSPSPQSSQ
jgi:hypothetical protein